MASRGHSEAQQIPPSLLHSQSSCSPGAVQAARAANGRSVAAARAQIAETVLEEVAAPAQAEGSGRSDEASGDGGGGAGDGGDGGSVSNGPGGSASTSIASTSELAAAAGAGPKAGSVVFSPAAAAVAMPEAAVGGGDDSHECSRHCSMVARAFASMTRRASQNSRAGSEKGQERLYMR